MALPPAPSPGPNLLNGLRAAAESEYLADYLRDVAPVLLELTDDYLADEDASMRRYYVDVKHAVGPLTHQGMALFERYRSQRAAALQGMLAGFEDAVVTLAEYCEAREPRLLLAGLHRAEQAQAAYFSLADFQAELAA